MSLRWKSLQWDRLLHVENSVLKLLAKYIHQKFTVNSFVSFDDLTMQVFLVIARRILFTSTVNVFGSIGIRFIFIRKYAAA